MVWPSLRCHIYCWGQNSCSLWKLVFTLYSCLVYNSKMCFLWRLFLCVSLCHWSHWMLYRVLFDWFFNQGEILCCKQPVYSLSFYCYLAKSLSPKYVRLFVCLQGQRARPQSTKIWKFWPFCNFALEHIDLHVHSHFKEYNALHGQHAEFWFWPRTFKPKMRLLWKFLLDNSSTLFIVAYCI